MLTIPLLGHSQVHRAYNRPEPVTQYLFKGGWQLASLMNSEFEASYQSGWLAGAAIKLPVWRKWGLQPELLYSRRKAQLLYPAQDSRAAYEAIHTFAFTEIPLLFVYRANDILELQAGPRLDILIDNDVASTSGQTLPRLTPGDLKRWDYAVTAGVEINVSPLAFGARYSYGILKLENSDRAREQLGGGQLHGLSLYGALVF